MTNDEIRIKIAKHCGWNAKPEKPTRHDNQSFGFQASFPRWWYVHQLPDYCGSLDAMHEAEKTLTPEQHGIYVRRLNHLNYDTVVDLAEMHPEWGELFPLVTATAQQRAEAFIKTITKD